MSNEAPMTTAQPRSGSSPRLYERVVDILSGQLHDGTPAVDEPMTETAIAARFGISRSPARRALEELEKAGLLVRIEPHGYMPRRKRQGSRGADAALTTGDEKLFSQPSWEPIYGEVESEIIARVSFGSWRLNEAELARHYGVSRTVSRDVIGRLQQRGVVRKDDRSRWYAPALTPQHVGELYELRWLLEPVALGKAASRLPEGLLDRMRERLRIAIAQPQRVDGVMLDSLERDLHVTLLGHCGNGALMQAIVQPQSLLIAHRFLYRWTSRMFESEPFLPEHLAIVEKVADGDLAEAAATLESHLRVSRDRALARIQAIAAGTQPEPLSYLQRGG